MISHPPRVASFNKLQAIHVEKSSEILPTANLLGMCLAPATAATNSSYLSTEIVDAVRGAAATYVMLSHARFLLFISVASVITLNLHGTINVALAALALTRYGHAAVMAFFLVSGYAIHYRQAAHLAAGDISIISWPRYALHRIRRLYPPLCAALLLTFALDTIGAHIYPDLYMGTAKPLDFPGVHTPTLRDFAGTLFFVQGFLAAPFGTDGPLWSLAYEGFFYVAYPVVLAVNRRLGPVQCLAAFVALGLGCALLTGLGIHFSMLSLLAYWPAWVAGTFIADIRTRRVSIPDSWWNANAIVGILLICALAIALVLKGPQQTGNTGLDILWVMAFFGPLGWLAAGRHSPAARARVVRLSRPFASLGTMSYSLYIVHFPVLALLSAIWLAHHSMLPRMPWLYLTGIVTSLAVAFVVYRAAERPFLSQARRHGFHQEGATNAAATK